MAEPNYNMQFDDNGGGNTSTNSPQEPQGQPLPPPTQLPTSDESVSALSVPLDTSRNTTNFKDFRVVEDDAGDIVYVKVSDFNQNGKITLVGNYSQNFVDLPKYDLSTIRTLSDINFNFILVIKETKTSPESVFYTSEQFYIELMRLYSNNQPYLPNYIIKQENIVVIPLDSVKELIADLHIKELNTFLSKEPTIVIKNLFEFSNYGPEPDFEINSTYDLDELVRYIDWVVSKPSPNYNERLLAPNVIGEWISPPTEDDTPQDTGINNTPGDGEPSNNEPQYPPIGRRGAYFGEIVESDSGGTFIWTNGIWTLYDTETGATGGSGNQSGGSGGGGNQGGGSGGSGNTGVLGGFS